MIHRRRVIQTLVSIPFATSASWSVAANATPELAKIMTGFPAGGTVDVLARRVADKLRGAYAANVVVDNKPGAAGQLGVITLKDSKPDGSVLLLTPSSMLSIYPLTYPKLQYTVDDVRPTSMGAFISHGLAVGPAVPDSVKTLKDFLAWTRANSARANFGSPGAGSMPHLIGILLAKFSSTSLQHIPYRGSVPGVQDLLGGQISAFCGPIGDYLPHLKSGKLRVLAVSSQGPSPFLPGVPTLTGLGFPVAVREWYGFFLPGKASDETTRRASAYLQTALAHPEVVDAGKQYGLDVQASSAGALAEMLKADALQWKRLIKLIGFSAES